MRSPFVSLVRRASEEPIVTSGADNGIDPPPGRHTSTASRTVTRSPSSMPSAWRTHAFTGTM